MPPEHIEKREIIRLATIVSACIGFGIDEEVGQSVSAGSF